MSTPAGIPFTRLVGASTPAKIRSKRTKISLGIEMTPRLIVLFAKD